MFANLLAFAHIAAHFCFDYFSHLAMMGQLLQEEKGEDLDFGSMAPRSSSCCCCCCLYLPYCSDDDFGGTAIVAKVVYEAEKRIDYFDAFCRRVRLAGCKSALHWRG